LLFLTNTAGLTRCVPETDSLIRLEHNKEVPKIFIKKIRMQLALCTHKLQALKMVMRDNVELVIMDIKMWSMHRLEAIARLRQRRSNIPIIIRSAYYALESDFIVKTSNVAAFMVKPVDINVLKSRVFDLIGG